MKTPTISKLLTKYNHNEGNASRIKYVVIHYVGALGGAKVNCQYYAGGNRNASAHYFVGFDGEIWQSVEDANIAWHCGANTYKHAECRNANSIGVEMCVRKKNTASLGANDKDWYFEEETVESAAELTRYLMEEYNVPASNVIRHYDVTGKVCPNPYVYNTTRHTWEEFKKIISSGNQADVKESEIKTPYKVKVDALDLRIRTGAGTKYAATGKYTGKGTFTITEEKEGKGSVKGWGKLKSGAGWIALDYCTKI